MTAYRPTRAVRRGDTYHHGDLRPALLEGGEVELAERGIEGFSLRGVAKRAGVSHAAPAHHFQDANGLLTVLAAEGFRRFLDFQKARQRKADQDPMSQLVAAGMGYIDFAMAHPALFRVMFSSDRPGSHDFDRLRFGCAWAIVHGFATLANSKCLKPLLRMRKSDRDSALEEMLRRSLK